MRMRRITVIPVMHLAKRMNKGVAVAERVAVPVDCGVATAVAVAHKSMATANTIDNMMSNINQAKAM